MLLSDLSVDFVAVDIEIVENKIHEQFKKVLCDLLSKNIINKWENNWVDITSWNLITKTIHQIDILKADSCIKIALKIKRN